MKNLGIYIHIPFCIRKCLYCDFLSFENTGVEVWTEYVEALNSEIKYYSEVYRNEFTVDSIFFGGGTPSLIDGNLIAQVLETVKTNFSVTENAEISIECNPKTLNEEKLEIYKESGINRLSIGVQTLNDLKLKSLGRAHKASDARATFLLAREKGFDNINLDLMFAIPDHTLEQWKETLEEAVNLKPEHISFYSLQLEEETKFYEMFQSNELDMVSEKVDREMYHYGVDFLKEKGYVHYEISNSAKEGFECKHNLKYWSMENYLGLGLGSHSFIEGKRFSNIINLETYIESLNKGLEVSNERVEVKTLGENIEMYKGENHEVPTWVDWEHENSQRDQMVDFIITGLRKLEGIDLKEFQAMFGQSICEAYPKQEALIRDYIEKGLLISESDCLRFSLKGVDISNKILAEFV